MLIFNILNFLAHLPLKEHSIMSILYNSINYPLFADLIQDAVFTSVDEVTESENKFEISLDLPGYKQQDIDISIERQILTISAKNQKRGFFTKKYRLGTEIDIDKIAAKLENGIINIDLPKLNPSRKRKIEVN